MRLVVHAARVHVAFVMVSARLNLVVLHATDIERSRRFYEAIGLVFVREQHGQGPVHYACQTGDFVLELYPRRAQDGTNGARASLTLGFSVPSLETVRERLKALADVHPAGKAESTANRQRLVDPDGHVVLLTASGDH